MNHPSALRSMTLVATIAALVSACGGSTAQVGPDETPVPPNLAFRPQGKSSRGYVLGGESVEVTVGIKGADAAYTFAWVQTKPALLLGEFEAADQGRTKFRTPVVTERTRFVLTCTVTGAKEAKSVAVDFIVEPLPNIPEGGSGPEPTGPVTTIVLQALVSAPAVLTGERVTLSVANSDQFTDFAWQQVTPSGTAGTFDDATASAPSFRAPAVGASQTFTIRVTAKDLTGALQTSDVLFAVTPATYNGQVKAIFEASCVGCHKASGPRAGLDITNADALFAPLVRTNCGTGNRIKPFAPSESGIIRRMKGECEEGGPRMPTSDLTLFEREPQLLDQVESWVLSGAKLND